MLSNQYRGLAVVLPFIDLGLTVAALEDSPGFEKLIPRIEMSDRSAISEANYAASLARAGYFPELEPAVETGLLDTAITVEGRRVYSEVISPERAQVIIAAHSDVHILANDLLGMISGVILEILLHSDINAESLPRIASILDSLEMGMPKTIDGFASIVQKPGVVPPVLSP